MRAPNGRIRSTATALATLALTACFGAPDLESPGDPLVVTEAGGVPVATQISPERAAAIADMRARGEAGASLGYPDVMQAEQNRRLAARPEPKPLAEVATIEAELSAISARRRAGPSAAELAELDRREAELRRLAAAAAAAAPPQ